jgi:hypothetical protein
VELITLTDEQKAAWRNKLQPVVDKWVAAQKAAGVPVDELIADIRRLEMEYKGATPDAIFQKTVESPVKGLLPQ